MNISITAKGGRKVKLSAADIRLFKTAAAMCAEIGNVCEDEDANGAAARLEKVLESYDPPPKSESKDKELAATK